MQHTSAPWRITKNEYTRLVFVGDDNVSYPLFRDIGSKRDWADAHLIAAAPELLEALRGLVQWVLDNLAYEQWQDENEEWQSYDDLPQMRDAYAAIEKAAQSRSISGGIPCQTDG